MYDCLYTYIFGVQVDIPQGYGSERNILFRKVFIPKGHYSEKFYP